MGKKNSEEEIDIEEIDNYDDYEDDELESMIDDIIDGNPDDNITVDNLHLVVEWIRRKL